MLKKQFSKSKPRCKVTFTLPKEAVKKGSSVELIGEWDNWDQKKAVKMKSGKNGYEATVELPTGRNYEFRYLIDKKKWENDWSADGYVPNPFGFDNSVVSVVSVPTQNEDKGAKKSNSKKTTKSNSSKSATSKKEEDKNTSTKKSKSTATRSTAKKKSTSSNSSSSKSNDDDAKNESTSKSKSTSKTTSTKSSPKKRTTSSSNSSSTRSKSTPKKSSTSSTNKSTASKSKSSTRSTQKGAKDDLKKIEGIGPKIAELLNKDGINTFSELGRASISRLEGILEAAGSRYKMHNPGSWPKQSKLAAKEDWEALKTMQDDLKGGR